MLRSANVALSRAWYTWSDRPAEMVFLPLGVRLTPIAYAGSTGRANLFGPGAVQRLGFHSLDAARVELDLAHAGTRIAWTYNKINPFTLLGSWNAVTLGEWGLRFWLNLCLSAEDGSLVEAHPAGGALVKVGHRFMALVTDETPVQITGHPDLAALCAEYEEHGYFFCASRSHSAPVLALRFNFEMMRQGRFALAVADAADLALAQARACLAQHQAIGSEAGTTPPAESGIAAGALDAIRDVMAWNTVWDETNGRPYTSISRNWNQAKFGGFGVWLNDQLYAALLTSLLDPALAGDNVAVALANATPQGNLACLLTANDAWVDRTQLPIGAFLLWLIFLRNQSRPLLGLAYAALARNHAWWWQHRDPKGLGLCSYGTSDVGAGLYKGTSFGARNESSMDNSPIHDEAAYDGASRTLGSIDVGLNALLALDAEMLALIAAELGQSEDAMAHRARAEAVRHKIRTQLWDESRGIFANRLWSGAFVRSLAPTSFYPLLCAAATPAQTERLLAALADPALFGGPIGLPAVSRQDPAYRDNVYWRGRVWPPLNYLVWQGLRRAGAYGQASALADNSFALFMRVWQERRLCPENYNAETGEPLDQPDTEGFYGWGALMPALAVGEIMDINPWRGWEIVNDGRRLRLGPIETPIGAVTLESADGILTLSRGGHEILVTNLSGRLSRIVLGPNHLSLTLPAITHRDAFIRLPGLAATRVMLTRQDTYDLAGQDVAGDYLIDLLPVNIEGSTLICAWTV